MLYDEIKNRIRSLLALQGMANKDLAKLLGWTEANLSQKLNRKTIRLVDVELMLNAIGYKLEIIENNNCKQMKIEKDNNGKLIIKNK